MDNTILTTIEQRINSIRAFLSVQGALDFTAIQKDPIPVNVMAFVVPIATTPKGDEYETVHGPVLQEETLTFGVVIAIKNAGDIYGGQGNEQLGALRKALNEKLHGWVPSEGYSAIGLAQGRLLGMSNQTVFWQQAYQTSTYQQGNAND